VTETEKLLGELVALPSVNPAFLPAGHRDAGEDRVAELLGVIAARAGLDVDFQKVARGRSNVIARLVPAGKTKRCILLAPHMDTVAAFSPDQFIPRVAKGRLHGRGACDTKGSVAAMLMALSALARNRRRPAQTEIIFCGAGR
jgi:acetylornithine deacetylase